MAADYATLTYDADGAIGRIVLNRPERGNAITWEMAHELVACVEESNLNPAVHVIALSGNGTGFCGGYDLDLYAEKLLQDANATPSGSPIDPATFANNHKPSKPWDPLLDYQGMSRFVKAYMTLFHSDKPVVCKVHGFCVAGGTDLALCSDLLVIADDAKIGYPPARVWGTPTTAMWVHRIGIERAKRLLFTGDCLTGAEAASWGLAVESAPIADLDTRFEALLRRIARMPINQLVGMKLFLNQTVTAQGLQGAQALGTLLDGISRHTPEGYAFQQRAAEAGFREAVRERDEPFGDHGLKE